MRAGLAVAVVVLLWGAGPALAHRLDEYLQDATLSLGRERVAVEMRLTPGVDVLRTVLGTIDTDGDGVISEAEQSAYVRWVVRELSISVDGRALPLRVRSAVFPTVEEMREGVGEIVIELEAQVPAGGAERTMVFENRHHRGISAYLVNCLVPEDPGIRIKGQRRSYDQSWYRVEYVQAGGVSKAAGSWAAWRWWVMVDTVAVVASVALVLRRRRAGASGSLRAERLLDGSTQAFRLGEPDGARDERGREQQENAE